MIDRRRDRGEVGAVVAVAERDLRAAEAGARAVGVEGRVAVTGPARFRRRHRGGVAQDPRAGADGERERVGLAGRARRRRGPGRG